MASNSQKKQPLTLIPTVKVVSIVHQQFQTLSCYTQVVSHLKQGFSFEYVRKLIQDKNQEWQEVAQEEVLARIGKLHHELTALDTVAPFLPGYVEAAAEEIENGLNEVKEIAELYHLQRKRIKMAMEKEETILQGFLSPNTVREIRLAKDLVESSRVIKASLGIKGGSKEVAAPVVPTTPGKFQSVDPKNASKILGIVKMIQDKAAKAGGN